MVGLVAGSRSFSAPTLIAAAALVPLGLAGLHQPGISFPSVGRAASVDARAMDEALDQQEAALVQRQEAELMLSQFIRAQMTRHYWGHFAHSLTDLGILSSKRLTATVVSSPAGSDLWLRPERGSEGYAAAVRQAGPRVSRWQCRGPLPPPGVQLSLDNGCPVGWEQIALRRG